MGFDFIKNRKIFYFIAVIIISISIFSMSFLNLNLWIDMTWWMQLEYDYTNNVDINNFKNIVNDLKKDFKYNDKDFINNTTVYKIIWQNKFIIEAGLNKFSNADLQQIDNLKTKFKDALNKELFAISSSKITLSKYVNIWETFWSYIKNTAYITLFLVIFFISIYIMWAFKWSIEWFSSFSFAFVTWISLFHDVIAALWFYIITSFLFPEFKIDTFFITAMLTVLGYSISDTIVVMDRIRFNLKQKINNKLNFSVIVNNSINDVFTRSILTSFTILIVLTAMFFAGPISIKGFVLAMIYGTIFGTYSSIALAAPLLYDINSKRK